MEHQTEKIVGAQKRKNFNKKILRRITNQIEKLQISEEVKRKNQNAVGKAEVPENKNGLLRSITPSDTDSGFNASEEETRVQNRLSIIMERPKRIIIKKSREDEIIDKFLAQSTDVKRKYQLQPKVLIKRLNEVEENIATGNWHIYLEKMKPKFKVTAKRTICDGTKVEYYICWTLKISPLQEDGWYTRAHVDNILNQIQNEMLFQWEFPKTDKESIRQKREKLKK